MEYANHINLGYCTRITKVTENGNKMRFYLKDDKLVTYVNIQRALNKLKKSK